MKVGPGEVSAGVTVAACQERPKVHLEVIRSKAGLVSRAFAILNLHPTVAVQRVGEDEH